MGSVMTCKLNPCCGDRLNCTGAPEECCTQNTRPASSSDVAELIRELLTHDIDKTLPWRDQKDHYAWSNKANDLLSKAAHALSRLSPPVQVTDEIEKVAWNCGDWPKWLHDLVDETNEVADRLDMSAEQAHAYAALKTRAALTAALTAALAAPEGETNDHP